MGKEVALFVEHEVKYTNAEAIPVRDVVTALLALERISSQFLPRTLNALAGVEVKHAELLVEGFEHGSLKEKVLIKLVFGDEAKLNDFLEKLHEGRVREAWQMLPGGHKVKLAIVGTTVAVLLAVGTMYVLKPAAPAVDITIIQVGAEAYNKSPDQVVEIVRAAVGVDSKKLAQETAHFMAPAKNDPAGTIVLDGNAKLTIPADTVRAMPREVAADPYESTIEYKDVDLEIRASDRDSSARGWAGVVRDLFDRRVKLVLADGIEAHSLANRFHVRADVVVTSRPDKAGKLVPAQIFVERIIPDNEE